MQDMTQYLLRKQPQKIWKRFSRKCTYWQRNRTIQRMQIPHDRQSSETCQKVVCPPCSVMQLPTRALNNIIHELLRQLFQPLFHLTDEGQVVCHRASSKTSLQRVPTFSVGLRSGECAEHIIRWIFSFSRLSWTELARWQRALLSMNWKVSPTASEKKQSMGKGHGLRRPQSNSDAHGTIANGRYRQFLQVGHHTQYAFGLIVMAATNTF